MADLLDNLETSISDALATDPQAKAVKLAFIAEFTDMMQKAFEHARNNAQAKYGGVLPPEIQKILDRFAQLRDVVEAELNSARVASTQPPLPER